MVSRQNVSVIKMQTIHQITTHLQQIILYMIGMLRFAPPVRRNFSEGWPIQPPKAEHRQSLSALPSSYRNSEGRPATQSQIHKNKNNLCFGQKQVHPSGLHRMWPVVAGRPG
ncbi:MAG TPA: hypothetical protein ENH02_00435 [Bacteroidetes bacterium]|nr:hypothetical protein [Bacteroidota bacterium]